jgi:uncharacterized protein
MKFEWDEAKRRLNLKKHGIDFIDILEAFDSPMWIYLDSRREYG